MTTASKQGWAMAVALSAILSLPNAYAESPFSFAGVAGNGNETEQVALADADIAPSGNASDEYCLSRWTFSADMLMLQRSARGGPTLLALTDVGSGHSLFNAGELGYHVGTGPRFSAIRRGHAGWGMELNYFQLDNYRARAHFENLPVGTVLHIDANGGPDVDSAHFVAGSQLQSGEVNLRRDVSDWLTPLVGFRWTELSESYSARGNIAGFLTPYEHDINAMNRLYGMQIGAQGVLWRRDNWRLETVLKAGLFANGADQTSLFDNASPFARVATATKRSHPAFLGELGFTLAYQLTERLSLRGGYQFLWIEGVALPTQQIDHTDLVAVPTTAALNCSNGLYYQGGSLGLELTW